MPLRFLLAHVSERQGEMMLALPSRAFSTGRLAARTFLCYRVESDVVRTGQKLVVREADGGAARNETRRRGSCWSRFQRGDARWRGVGMLTGSRRGRRGVEMG